MVYGSRYLTRHKRRVLYFYHTAGNLFLTLLSNLMTNLNLTDVATCYKLMTREVVDAIQLKEKGFSFDPELTAKIARKRFRIFEIPISYYGRTYEQGKKIGLKDVGRYLYTILKYNIVR